MKTATIIQHVAFEDLGSFEEVLRLRGFQSKLLLAGRDSFSAEAFGDPDLAIVLGGPISVNDTALYPFLTPELAFIKHRLDAQRPCLGVCLGAQLMAKALGATVKPMGYKEIGWSRLNVEHSRNANGLSLLGEHPVLHWHGERFELPEGAIRLASTKLCDNQAFAIGSHALGLQFHLEATERGLEQWYVGHCAELEQAKLHVPTLRGQTQAHAETLVPKARLVLSTWLSGCGL